MAGRSSAAGDAFIARARLDRIAAGGGNRKREPDENQHAKSRKRPISALPWIAGRHCFGPFSFGHKTRPWAPYLAGIRQRCISFHLLPPRDEIASVALQSLQVSKYPLPLAAYRGEAAIVKSRHTRALRSDSFSNDPSRFFPVLANQCNRESQPGADPSPSQNRCIAIRDRSTCAPDWTSTCRVKAIRAIADQAFAAGSCADSPNRTAIRAAWDRGSGFQSSPRTRSAHRL